MTRKRFVKLVRAKLVGRKGIDWRKFENGEREFVITYKEWTYKKLLTLVFNALDACESAEANK